MPSEILLKSVIAGILASIACGMGAFPLLIRKFDPQKQTGLGYSFAGGLMFAASVYNLILPGLTLNQHHMGLSRVLPVLSGIILGALFLWTSEKYFNDERISRNIWQKLGGRAEILIFIAMSVHSIPEGIAVGVGFASEEVYSGNLGIYIAIAIAIHNIPEGLAVAIPLRVAGASIHKCFWAAFLTSLPQPIAAIPAGFASWFFRPMMPTLMGFAAGAMIFLILMEMLPAALHVEKAVKIAWAFILGFCMMMLVQVLL